MSFARLWRRLFLVERPSLSLSLFRLAVAFTVGAHMIPNFFPLEDNYLSGAFVSYNFPFFPVWALRLAAGVPDWIVYAMLGVFFTSLAAFTAGLFTQLSCIVLTLSCYFFYARNDLHIGTLSFDILLVTLFLMCVTPYPGDALSLDSVRRGDVNAYRRLRPFFLQRLLQLQLAWTFWYTALSKISATGNWLTDNPYYYLMQYPPQGVVRSFPLREWLAQQPQLCYQLGITLIMFELALPFLWFIPRLRRIGIPLGIAFQLMLWATLHVPTIFLFLFPALMLLFIPPEDVVRGLERIRARAAAGARPLLLYDGQCGFCLASVTRLRVLDVFGQVAVRDFHVEPDLPGLHPDLSAARCRSEMVLLEPGGRLTGGFDAFRRLCVRLPWLWPLAPLVFMPGARWVGTRIYRWVATHRYLLHRNPVCASNQCAINSAGTDPSSKT